MEIKVIKNNVSTVEFSSPFGFAYGKWRSQSIPIIGNLYFVEMDIPSFESIERSYVNRPFMDIVKDTTRINMLLSIKEESWMIFCLNDDFIHMIIDNKDDLIIGEYYLISSKSIEVFDCNY